MLHGFRSYHTFYYKSVLVCLEVSHDFRITFNKEERSGINNPNICQTEDERNNYRLFNLISATIILLDSFECMNQYIQGV